MSCFEINNDLNKIVFSFHNKFHFFGSMLGAVIGGFLLTPLYGFLIAYAIGVLWEIKDGFAYWWNDPEWQFLREEQPTVCGNIKYYIIRNLILSDKLSLQDLLVWDLGGSTIGLVIVLVIGKVL